MATMTGDPKLDELPVYSERPVDPPAYTTAEPKKRTHWGRYRWCYIFLIICIILVISVPIMYVFYPRPNTNTLEVGNLNVTSVTIRSTAYRRGGSVRVTANYITNSTSEVQVQPWYALVGFGGYSKPGIKMPAFTAVNRTEFSYDLSPESRDDITSFINVFCVWQSQAKSTTPWSVRIDGQGNTAPLNGMQGKSFFWSTTSPLKSLSNCTRLFPEITFEWLNRTGTDGSNASGGITFINDSIFRIDFGTLEFRLSRYGRTFATITVPNADLWPGKYTLPFTALFSLTTFNDVYSYPDLSDCALRDAELTVFAALGDGEIDRVFHRGVEQFWWDNAFRTSINMTTAWARGGYSPVLSRNCSTVWTP